METSNTSSQYNIFVRSPVIPSFPNGGINVEIWKESVLTYLKVLSHNLPRETEENCQSENRNAGEGTN
jgi:hypothetical protein